MYSELDEHCPISSAEVPSGNDALFDPIISRQKSFIVGSAKHRDTITQTNAGFYTQLDELLPTVALEITNSDLCSPAVSIPVVFDTPQQDPECTKSSCSDSDSDSSSTSGSGSGSKGAKKAKGSGSGSKNGSKGDGAKKSKKGSGKGSKRSKSGSDSD